MGLLSASLLILAGIVLGMVLQSRRLVLPFDLAMLGIVGAKRDVTTTSDSPPAKADSSLEQGHVGGVSRYITSLGRLQPEGEVVRLSASPLTGTSRIEKLLVVEGDWVKPNQVIALLEGTEVKTAVLARAESQVAVAEAQLAKVRSGASSNDIAAQQATVNRLSRELANAEVELARFQQLHERGAVSDSFFDGKSTTVDTIRQQLSQAKSQLDGLETIRPEDIKLAEAEVNQAKKQVQQAMAELELLSVRSPQAGRVLEIWARPGEIVTERGIAEIAQTDRMNVIAEVYEADIDKIKIGQSAVISSPALPKDLTGTIVDRGWKVNTQEVFGTSPVTNTDDRVIDVTIRLDPDSVIESVQILTNLQVDVKIFAP